MTLFVIFFGTFWHFLALNGTKWHLLSSFVAINNQYIILTNKLATMTNNIILYTYGKKLKKFCSNAQLAKYLGKSRRTIARYVQQGQCPHGKLKILGGKFSAKHKNKQQPINRKQTKTMRDDDSKSDGEQEYSDDGYESDKVTKTTWCRHGKCMTTISGKRILSLRPREEIPERYRATSGESSDSDSTQYPDSDNTGEDTEDDLYEIPEFVPENNEYAEIEEVYNRNYDNNEERMEALNDAIEAFRRRNNIN